MGLLHLPPTSNVEQETPLMWQVLQLQGRGSLQTPQAPPTSCPLARGGSLTLGSMDILDQRILFRGAILCTVECLTASLTSTHSMPLRTPSLVVTLKNVIKHCQVSPPNRGYKNLPGTDTHYSNYTVPQCLQGKWYSKFHQLGAQPA